LFVEERLTALLLIEVLMNLFRGRRSAFASLLFVEVFQTSPIQQGGPHESGVILRMTPPPSRSAAGFA
jgi:hypothetical protein